MSLNLDFKVQKEQKVREIEDSLQNYLPKQKGYQKIIMEAMGYSLLAGGKRLRPMLMKETYTLFGGHSKVIEPFMAAIEMVHTYSLVHDDLPAMDNDDYRRGKLTCHKAFNEGLAILAGDGLLTYAFDVMLSDALEKRDFKYVYATKTIAKLSGMNGMLVGQVVDVESEGKEIDADTLLYIHDNKTAGLIKAALLAGAAIGGADEESLKILEKVGYNIGVAFQIKDDILDVTSTTEVLGKPVLSDEKNDKVTYVSLYGLDKAQKDFETLSEEAIELLKKIDNCEFLVEYVNKLINRIK